MANSSMSFGSKLASDKSLMTIIHCAAEKLGFVLKEKQFEAIFQFCQGKDVFASLPTGYVDNR